MSEPSDVTTFQFELGTLVEHRMYGYRGAIFGRDPRCMADDEWYESNQTQPDRGQPWYHVLVHGSEHTTYVAEENLDLDGGAEQVVHPLTHRFFSGFASGRYVLAGDGDAGE